MRHFSNTLNVTFVRNHASANPQTEQTNLRCGRFLRAVLLVAVVLEFVIPTRATADQVSWSPNVESALRTANDANRLVLMKFTAEWCGPCKRFERETFTRSAVAQYVNQNFVPVLVDIDKRKNLAKHLKITRVPAVLIVSPDMVVLSRTTGFQSAQKLLPNLQKIAAAHSRSTSSPSKNIAGLTKSPSAPTLPVSRQVTPAESKKIVPGISLVPPTVPDSPAFEGLCLSAVQETRSLVSGMPELALQYRDKLLYFSSAEQMQNFRMNPKKYWPRIDGVCPVTLTESGQKTEGKLKYAAIFRQKLWLLSSAENMKKFVSEPTRYITPASSRMAVP